jgi:DNA-binding IclR family transcriptional regulator
MSDKTQAPALDRGLDILELIAESGPLSYRAIIERLGLPQASAARILKRLCCREYAIKDENGEYCLGPALETLRTAPDMPARLRRAGEAVLKRLRDTIGQTAILFHWNGTAWECVAKETHEDSITMPQVGEVRVDIFDYPWGVFAYEQLLKEDRKLVLKADTSRLEKRLKAFVKDGYVADSGRSFSRLAAPLKDSGGNVLGALAMGVVGTDVNRKTQRNIAGLIMAGARQIETHMRRSSHEHEA